LHCGWISLTAPDREGSEKEPGTAGKWVSARNNFERPFRIAASHSGLSESVSYANLPPCPAGNPSRPGQMVKDALTAFAAAIDTGVSEAGRID
jgi:hypothetical protein